MMRAGIFVWMALFAASEGATLSDSMKDTQALLGEQATFKCELDGTHAPISEKLLFYKLFGADQKLQLSDNNQVLNTTKHWVSGTYTLTISDVTYADNGTYECSFTGTNPRTTQATLSVGVAPTQSWMYYKGNVTRPTSNVKTNLTCEADKSWPPATFRWFRNDLDVTSLAKYPTPTVDANGFGSAISYLEVTPGLVAAGFDTNSDDDDCNVLYTCHVDSQGKDSVFMHQIMVAGSSTIVASIAMLTAALFATKL